MRPTCACVHYPALGAKNGKAAEADIPLVAPRPSVSCDCERERERVKELPSSKKKKNLQPYTSFRGRRETQATPDEHVSFRHPSRCLQLQVTDTTLGFPQEGWWWWWWWKPICLCFSTSHVSTRFWTLKIGLDDLSEDAGRQKLTPTWRCGPAEGVFHAPFYFLRTYPNSRKRKYNLSARVAPDNFPANPIRRLRRGEPVTRFIYTNKVQLSAADKSS